MELASQPAAWELAGQDGKMILAGGLPYAELVLDPARCAPSSWTDQPLRCCASVAGPPRWSWSAPAGTASCPACGRDGFLAGSRACQRPGRDRRGRWRPVSQAPGPVVVGSAA